MKIIKNLFISAAIVFNQLFLKENKITLLKGNGEEDEEKNDISEDYKRRFRENAIEYNATNKNILHEYYKLFNEVKCNEMYVTGVVGKRILLKNFIRPYFDKVKNAKTIKRV